MSSETVDGACLVCGDTALKLFLDLGETALANKFLTAEEAAAAPEATYPLRLCVCDTCHHVQLADPVPPAAMFEDYLYISSASQTLVDHLDSLARAVSQRKGLGTDALVMDIGCNDGTLLSKFHQHSACKTLGVDPAKNLADMAREKGITVETGFFGAESAPGLKDQYGQADVITLTNVFPHIPDLAGLLKGFDVMLAADGMIALEAHYWRDFMEMMAFDTVYHEHVSYWALGPAKRLFESAGFEVFDVERLPVHHGQIRLWVARKGQQPVSDRVQQMLADEQGLGFTDTETYLAFGEKAERIRAEMTARLSELLDQGKRIAGYGAPAKGSTLLSALNLTSKQLSYIVDRSPLKQGRMTPGTHIPIEPTEKLLDDKPDFVLILAWNFADEIMNQQAEYYRQGGRFLVPLPEVTEVFPASGQQSMGSMLDVPVLEQAEITVSDGTFTQTERVYSERGKELVDSLAIKQAAEFKRMYDPTWMGVPIIQTPADVVAMQQLVWTLKPDVIIECGVAHGGSLILYASLLTLLGKGQVIGVDIEIRSHNREAIENHAMSDRIRLIERSSVAPETLDELKQACDGAETVLVVLDSDHSRDHVAQELDLYADLVTPGSYLVAMDGAQGMVWDIPRGKGVWRDDNPLPAIDGFLAKTPAFEMDPLYTSLGPTSSPNGFLKRVG